MAIRAHYFQPRFFLACACLLAFASTPGRSQTLRFSDVTSAAGVSTPNDANGYGHGVAAGDFNNDGRPDIFVVNYTALNALFRNNGNGSFSNIANNAGVAHSATLEDRGAAAADYDNDGDLDIYVTTSANFSNLLYRNNGNGSFSEGAGSAGLSNHGMQGQGAAWGDYDNDGLLDLFLCSFDHSYRLFRQNANHSFDEVSHQAGLDGATGSTQAVFFDCDLDGDLDLFVARGMGLPNRLFVNEGDGSFSEESQARGVADPGAHGQGVAVGDYDNDGDLDLYMCNDQGANRLYRNQGGYFNEAANEARVQDNSRSLGCHFADFNNDGWLDLYVINFGRNRLYRNNGDGTFGDFSEGSGADNADRSYGSAVLDYDNDGLLDIYFSNSGPYSNLLKNVSGTSTKWLKIALRGAASNRNGIGARVLVASGGRQQMQQLLAGFAMVSGGGDLTFHFGLGGQSSAERVEVLWPSGQRDVVTNVSANQSLTIQEGSFGGGQNDNIPPAISNVQVNGLSGASATITWVTNEAADSQVEYGLTTAYGGFSALGAVRVTSHSVGLTGLTANTTYHFRVLSRDAAGNVARSSDFTFTTTNQNVLLSDNFSGTALDPNKWNVGSNSGNQATLENQALSLRSTSSHSGWIVTKNAYAGANKIAKVRIVQPNDDGDLGMSPTVNLASSNAFYGQNNWYRFYVYRDGHAGNYLLFAQWRRNGAVDGVEITNGLKLPAVFWLRLRTNTTTIFFEYSPDEANWTTVYAEAFSLPGYSLSNSYFFEIAGNNTPSNGILKVDDFSLLEAVAPPDARPPVITKVAAGNLTSTSATITWSTDEAADSQVEYGTTTSYGLQSPLDAARVTSHSIQLTGLSANTVYHYRVKSKDAAGNRATSNDFTFTTPANSALIFSDDFNGTGLDGNKWRSGSNSGNLSRVTNRQLELNAQAAQTGWVITRNAYAARHRAVSVKITQPNADGSLGMSPTYAGASTSGIYHQAAWYRFYVYRDAASGPYKLCMRRKKNGAIARREITGNAILNGAFFMRLRCDGTRIYFEFSIDGQAWTVAHSEPFGLPGYTLDSAFYYELAAHRTEVNGILRVDDFAIQPVDAGPDQQAPLISQVGSGNISSSATTISWNTDEASDSQVEYGTTMNYGSASALNSARVTKHAVDLTGLAANTVYHYRVRSRDAAGNLAVSKDFTFTTASAGGSTLLADNFNSGSLDLNKWTKGENSGNQTAVAGNALELRSSGTQTAWIVTKQKYAARNTAVTVKVVQPNNDGNLGMAPAFLASAANGLFTQANWYRFYTYREQASGPYRLYAQWKKNGAVDGVDVTGTLNITSTVYLRLRFDNSRIHFEASLNGQSWTDTYNEVFALPGYTLDDAFHYELAAYATENRGRLTVDDFGITATSTALAKEAETAGSEGALPTAFALSQSYPNPFQLNTRVRLALPQEAQVQAVIFDLLGREVWQLYRGHVPAGYRELDWQGTAAAGQRVDSGVYFLRVILATPDGRREVLTRQLHLMR